MCAACTRKNQQQIVLKKKVEYAVVGEEVSLSMSVYTFTTLVPTRHDSWAQKRVPSGSKTIEVGRGPIN